MSERIPISTNRTSSYERYQPTVPWWLFPNLFALDAPIVALVWQRFFALLFKISVPWAASGALFFAVWSIYLCDHLLDALRGNLDSDRHRLADRYRYLFFNILTITLAATTISTLNLSNQYVRCGITVAIGVVLYLVVINSMPARFVRLIGIKELLVGFGFSTGVTIPLCISTRPVSMWFPSAAAFGLLCWVNCRLIDRWESNRRRSSWTDTVPVVTLFLSCFYLPTIIILVVFISCFGFLIIERNCIDYPRAARVLADVVLLSPLLMWGYL